MPKQAAEFEFFHPADRSVVLQGFVHFRGHEMLLEVEEPDSTPWDIRGKANGPFYEGAHRQLPGDESASAKWILLDDVYVGTWRESRADYMFKFRLHDSD